MKPRSNTDAKASPQRKTSRARPQEDSARRANSKSSLSRKLNDDEELPGDRGAAEKESATQGSE